MHEAARITVALGDRMELGRSRRAPRSFRGEGQTVMFVAIDGRATGLLSVADPDQDLAA